MPNSTRTACLAFAALLPLLAGAQGQSFRQALPEVSAAGYYRIALTPALTARAAPDLHDLRLRDAAGAEISYLIDEARKTWSRRGFRPFRLLRQGREADGFTHILFYNDRGGLLDALLLEVRNTGAARTAAISGSNDGRQFFSLRDTLRLEAPVTRSGDTAVFALPLPQTRYPYLQVTLFDDKLLPVDVLRGGVSTDSSGATDAYRAVPAPGMSQQDSSDRRSYIRLRLDAPYRVDRLTLAFAGPALYRRDVSVWTGGMVVASGTAASGLPLRLPLATHDTGLLVVVANEDNPPLRLVGATAEQEAQDLLAWLEPGARYALYAGDARLRAPVYDLRHYRDSIRQLSLPLLVPGEAPVPEAQAVKPESPSSRNKILLWGAVALVLAGLVWATLGLARRVGGIGK